MDYRRYSSRPLESTGDFGTQMNFLNIAKNEELTWLY